MINKKHLGFVFSIGGLYAMSAQALMPGGMLEPKVIYGSDNRHDLYQEKDAIVANWADSVVGLFQGSDLTPDAKTGLSAITSRVFADERELCADEPFRMQPTAAFCSGSLIADDIIMTAGHCVRSQEDCADIKFAFGFKVSQEGVFPSSLPTDEVYGCKTLIGRLQDNEGSDWSLIRLDRKVLNHTPLALNTSGPITVGQAVTVIGHPAGLPLKIADGANVRAIEDGFFVANLDTYGGNSGSPVFNSTTGKVEGILVRGEQDFTYDYKKECYKSNVCPSTGCRGEDVTLISAVIPNIPAAGKP